MTNIIRSTLTPIQEAIKPYIALNIAYYGLILGTMAIAAFTPALQQSFSEAVIGSLDQGPLGPLLEAYSTGHVLLSISLTFGINLVLGSFLWITLPSMVVPFSGLLLAGVRAVMWGLLFYPQYQGEIGVQEVMTGPYSPAFGWRGDDLPDICALAGLQRHEVGELQLTKAGAGSVGAACDDHSVAVPE